MSKKINIQNLKPFKKGYDSRRNYDGRPPDVRDLNDALTKVLNEDEDGVSALEAILKSLRLQAAKGNVRAAELLLDRAFGKAKQQIDHTSGGEKLFMTPEERKKRIQELKSKIIGDD